MSGEFPLNPLPRSFYNRDTIIVAKELLGAFLVNVKDGTPRTGRIVEVEAYLGTHDKACHSSRGMTPRTRIMFGPPGHAYVYMIYGMYHCMNVVTEREGQACAVLIRAVEPVENIEGRTNGPGLLCRSMGIDRTLNGHDLESQDFYIWKDETVVTPFAISERPRVGVHYAEEWTDRLLRFYLEGNRFVSKP